jgi:hypothetical protein
MLPEFRGLPRYRQKPGRPRQAENYELVMPMSLVGNKASNKIEKIILCVALPPFSRFSCSSRFSANCKLLK